MGEFPMTGPTAGDSVVTRTAVAYAKHDGVELNGELYLPQGREQAPILVAVHGGGWQLGSPDLYRYWGPLLGSSGFALFAIHYRLSQPGARSYPAAVYDVKAAVQFVRANALQLSVDPDRIGMIGDSAGAHLAALVALAGDGFATEYRDDPHAATPAHVKAVIGFYGVYDLLAQWEHDQLARPRDQISEKFIGASPIERRRTFIEASPLSYVTDGRAEQPRFMLIWGSDDEIVDPCRQSQSFLAALQQAGFFVRSLVLPGAGHFWAADPIAEFGSHTGQAAPALLRFLDEALR